MKFFFIVIFFITRALAVEIEVAIGDYYSNAKGTVAYLTEFLNGSTAKIDNGYQNQFYTRAVINFKEEYVPKFEFEFTHIRSLGLSTINVKTSNTIINDIIEGLDLQGKVLNSYLTYNMYDMFFYYEYFEESIYPTFTLGAGIKSVDFDYDVDVIESIKGVQFNETGESAIPMLYIGIKKTFYKHYSFDINTKYYFGASDIYDTRLTASSMYVVNENINAGFEVGYRDFYADVKGADVVTIGGDMHYQGFLFALVGQFK